MSEITERLKVAIGDRYVIERELGAGGMATVYLAEDLKHKRKVALKVLRPELAAVLGAERFVQEITTTAALQHPHILPLFDSGTAGQRDGGTAFLYYVMPYIEGETLREKLDRETQLSIDEAVRIASEVADALDYAHRHGVIHRDIKPENILLHDGRPMVADFGIALAVSAAAGGRMTETGMSLGTPHYMSPEQATAEKEITARSDVYSLGSVLYEMLTGSPPHVGSSAQQIIMKIVTEEAAPVTTVRKSVPPNVAAAVTKSLERLPADRFDTAKAFAEALANPSFTSAMVADGHAVVPSSRRPVAIPILATALVFAAALAAWGWLRPHHAALPVIRYSIVFPENEALYRQYGTSFALSPDGNVLAYASATERGSQLRVRDRDQLTSRVVPSTEDVWQPFFSPDGRHVAIITQSRKLEILSLSGEPPRVVADSGMWRNGGSWGTDGYLYIGWQQNGTVLSRIPVEGGEAEAVTVLDTAKGEVSHGWPEALPSGKGVLFTVGHLQNQTSESDQVAVVDLQTGRHHPLVQGLLGRYVPGYLIFVRNDSTVLAAPFDQDKLALTGVAVPVVSGVPVEAGPDLAVSASGRLVYASVGSRVGSGEIVWLERSGVTRPVEDGWTVTPNLTSGPVLSPDGTRLALGVQEANRPDIWIKTLNERVGPFTRLTFDANSVRPVWRPDGRSVTYRTVQPGLSYDLLSKRADGSGPPETLLNPAIEVASGIWSPDGKWLVVSTVGGDIYVHRTDADTTEVEPLLTEPFFESAPDVSPNGRWLVYVSDESGRPEVYVRSFPDVARVKQQVSTSGGVEPRWAHSGNELFYRGPAGEFIAVSVRAQEAFSVVERKTLFTPERALPNYAELARYDVSRDDQRFIAFRPAETEGGPGSVVVVENFLEELKGKTGR